MKRGIVKTKALLIDCGTVDVLIAANEIVHVEHVVGIKYLFSLAQILLEK